MIKIEKIMATVLLVLGVLAVAGLVCLKTFGADRGVYYTQIDNSKMEKINPSGGVVNFKGSHPYSYTLLCYDKKGRGKELTFGASRELRENAFVRVVEKPVRGVVEWKEVQYEELPEAVQGKYWRRIEWERSTKWN